MQLEANNRDGPDASDTIDDIKAAASAIYGAGVDTVRVKCSEVNNRSPDFIFKTWSTLSIFFLAMVLNPEHQARAQREIDSVIGSGRLPEFGDRPSLPYVECILQETLRYPHFLIRSSHFSLLGSGGTLPPR